MIKKARESALKIIGALAAAFGMFTAIPAPGFLYQLSRDKNNKRNPYILCAFPAVGLVIGLSWRVWIVFSVWTGFPDLLRGAGLCLLPLIITGGIHLDGYADTCDALASYASPERRREILHDPRRGAFAMIKLCAYFIGYFALCTAYIPDNQKSVPDSNPDICLILLFIFSRCLSGTALLCFPLSSNQGMAYDLKSNAGANAKKIILLESALTDLILCMSGWTGCLILVTALWDFRRADKIARRDFGGWSGDLSGWFLQKVEFDTLAVLTFAQYIFNIFL